MGRLARFFGAALSLIALAAGCAMSSGSSGREDGGAIAADANHARDGGDGGVHATDAPPGLPDVPLVGPMCGDLVCAPFEACVSGACAPYPSCVSDAMCDSDALCRNRYCIPRGTDVDGDGVPAETDCDESNPLRFPGGTELCDTRDQDCDANVDEGVARACSTACGAGMETCVGGAFVSCDAPAPSAETCNGVDDDCNGSTDEGLSRACATACGMGTETCTGAAGGAWAMCTAPPVRAETCNLTDDDCDGTCDVSVGGCRVAVNRSVHPSRGEHFYTTSASEAVCCGFTLEYANYYRLYASAQPGLVAFHRCVLSSGFHFYTTSATCEGASGSIMEGVMGYLATAAGVCGSVPLYRLARGNDHFYTTSAAERDSAIATGWINEGTAGYVWTGP